MKIKVDGIDKALKNIQRYSTDVQNGVKKEVASATIAIESGAVQRTPVDSGNAKGSWFADFENNGYTGIVANPVHYVVYLEFGTVKMAAQPMLIPSYEHHIPTFLGNVKKVLKP